MSIVNKNLPRSASTPSPSGSNSAAHTPLASPVDFISNTPTSLTRVLTYTSPFVHSFSHFLSLVTWQTNNPAESCLLVAAWWTLCLFPRELLVYGTHIILIGWIAWRWIEKGKRERLGKPNPIARSVSQLDLNQTVEEIHKISEKLSNFHGIVKDLDSHINWSNPSQTQIVILGLLYSYPVWIVLNFLISLKWIFLVTGTVVLVWNGPWFRVIRYSLMQSPLFRGTVSFLIGFIWGGRLKQEGVRGFSVASLIRKAKEQQKKLIARKASKDDSKTSTTDLIFRFVLYENQRWWLGLDWTTNLFPNERAPWSDEYNEPTNNKNSFQLPPPTTSLTASPNEPNMLIRKTEEWRWADSDWWLDLEGDVDKDGWEYADNRWKSFTSKGGFRRYTRRRKWVRNARMVETIEKSQNPSNETSLPRISRGPDGKFELNGIQNLNPVVTPKSDLNERNTSIVYEKELHNLF